MKSPSEYSLDGKCGPATGDKKCGGKWGSCCGKNNVCGDGPSYCGIDNCLYGNCTVTDIPTNPGSSPDPFYYYGNTTDGSCGPINDNKVCNVAWGFCCAGTGKCGDGPLFCGTGCQPGYGNCTITTVPPVPKPGDPSPGEYKHIYPDFGSSLTQPVFDRWNLWRCKWLCLQRLELR